MTYRDHKGNIVERRFPGGQVLLANGKPAYTAREPEDEPGADNVVKLVKLRKAK